MIVSIKLRLENNKTWLDLRRLELKNTILALIETPRSLKNGTADPQRLFLKSFRVF